MGTWGQSFQASGGDHSVIQSYERPVWPDSRKQRGTPGQGPGGRAAWEPAYSPWGGCGGRAGLAPAAEEPGVLGRAVLGPEDPGTVRAALGQELSPQPLHRSGPLTSLPSCCHTRDPGGAVSPWQGWDGGRADAVTIMVGVWDQRGAFPSAPRRAQGLETLGSARSHTRPVGPLSPVRPP